MQKLTYRKAKQLFQQGSIAYQNNQLVEAEQALEEALEIFSTLNAEDGIAATLTNLGAVYSSLEQFSKAINALNEAIGLHNKHRNREGEAMATYTLAHVYIGSMQYFQAHTMLKKALRLLKEIGNKDLTRETELAIVYIGAKQAKDVPADKQLEFDQLFANFSAYTKTASNYRLTGNPAAAAEFWDKALAFGEAAYEMSPVSLRQIMAEANNEAGYTKCWIGNHTEGIQNLIKAVELSKDIGDKHSRSAIFTNIGCAYYDMREFEKAIEYLQKAIDLRLQINDLFNAADNLAQLALTLVHKKENEVALQHLQKAHDIFEKIQHDQGKKRVEELINDINNNKLFSEHYMLNKPKTISKQGMTFETDITSLFQQAKQFEEDGDFERASSVYEKLLILSREHFSDTEFEAEILLRLGFSYRRANRVDGALLAYQQALKLAQKNRNEGLEATSLNNIGVTYQQFGQSNTALEYLKKAATLRRKFHDKHELGLTLFSISEISNDRPEQKSLLAEALSYINPEISIDLWRHAYDRLKDHLNEDELNQLNTKYSHIIKEFDLNNKLTMEQLEQHHTFIPLFGDDSGGIIVTKIDKRTGFPSWTERYTKAKFLWDISSSLPDERSNAIDEIFEVIKEIEQDRIYITSEEHRQGFFASQWDVYDTLINYLTESNQPDKALEVIEKTKTRSVLEKTNNAVLLASEIPYELQRKFRLAHLNYQHSIKELENVQKKVALYDQQRSLLANVELGFLGSQADLNDIIARIKRYIPDFDPQEPIPPITFDNIKQLIDSEKHALIVFWFGSQTQGVFSITTNKIAYYNLENKPEVESAIDSYQQLINSEIENFKESLPNLMRAFYDLLVAPIIRELEKENIKQITVIPHHRLHLLPFHSFVAGDGRYLLDRFEINYSPSFSLLNICNTRAIKERTVDKLLVLADPDSSLSFAKTEGKLITNLFKEADLLQGSKATPNALQSSSKNYRYLHFACHGGFQEAQRHHIGLKLAPNQNHTGFLTVEQILNDFELSEGAMVVLSGCNTGRTIIDKNDEFFGLSSAFIIAGAGQIIGSLWPVNDLSTAWLMKEFYKNLTEGQTSTKAMQNAQKWLREVTLRDLCKCCEELIEEDADTWEPIHFQLLLSGPPSEKPYANPYFWAPFFCIGTNNSGL